MLALWVFLAVAVVVGIAFTAICALDRGAARHETDDE